jgi:hypothetical protein
MWADVSVVTVLGEGSSGRRLMSYSVGSKLHIKIKATEETWVAKVRYVGVLMVRFSVRRLNPEITDEHWDMMKDKGKLLVDKIVKEMHDNNTGIGLTGLKKIEQWCLEGGAKETNTRELLWDGIKVYFAYLYAEPKKQVL